MKNMEVDLIIQQKVQRDLEKYKRRNPDMTSEEEKMLVSEFTRIQTELAVIREKEEKSRRNRNRQKNIENIEKKGSKIAKKQQKTRDFLSKNENQQRHTGEIKEIDQNTLELSDNQHVIRDSRQQYYSSSEWQKLSSKKREKNEETNNGLCQLCGKNKATEVHHLVKFYNQDSEELRNELLLDEDNVICLCSECHHNIHSKRGLLDVQQKKIIDQKRQSINQKYFNMGQLLNMSDICFLNY